MTVFRLTAAALAALAVPAAAGAAPVVEPLKPCYVAVQTGSDSYTTEQIVVAGSGFSPSSLVDLSIDGQQALSGVATDASGTLPGTLVPAPVVTDGQRPFSLTVAEQDTPTSFATAASKVSALTVKARPRRAAPRQTVRFRGRGFTADGAIYAHYLRHDKLRRTVRLARPHGDCGTFSVKRPQFPFRPSEGVWRVQVDQRRRLSDEGPLVNLLIDVRRRPLR